LAYNGRDVRANAVNYAELLVPGQQLRVRVKRGGRTRELSVLVGARPPLERTVTLQRTPCASGAACDRVTSFAFTVPPATAFPPPPPGVVAPPGSGDGTQSSAGMAVLAGAQMATIDDEFAQSMGVEPGVLVLRAPAGSLAAEAGLHAGDVIRAVNGRAVRDLTVLQRAFNATGVHDLRLTVLAKGNGARTVWLRW
jgi:S1-C subfamily serine protease